MSVIDNSESTSKSTFSNISPSIESKLNKKLHLNPSHPIGIIKDLVHGYFDSMERKFEKYDNFNPIVTVENNFDRLLIPVSHPARSKSDTYYVDENNVLRTHTSAHQNELLSRGITQFLVTGDVYRKDEIDSTHYPVFHQMEGVWIDMQETMTETEIGEDLIKTLKGLCNHLFPDCPVRVSGDYFPFTDPSYQMDVFYGGRWIEILGCGVVNQQIIKNCSNVCPELSINSSTDVKKGWAFGIGLDRLAMILFEIPDIRLLWVDSDKFIKQFKPNTIAKFKPYSVLPTICKDVSFYIPGQEVEEIQTISAATIFAKIEDVEKYTDKKSGIVRIWTRENDMYESIRESANNLYPDIVEKVEMFDQYYNNKLSKLSRAYRIHYSAPDPEMNDPGKLTQLVNQLHANISKDLNRNLNVEIR